MKIVHGYRRARDEILVADVTFVTMTTEQVTLVKNTWKMLRGVDPGIVGDAFYSKLFADNPGLRKMFPENMEAQYRKLIDMLNTIVARLERPADMNEEITAMAKRHVQYGARPAHYRLVGKALLWTLQQALGRDWTPEVATAWLQCYTMLSNTMMAAADEP
jgi:hemoglobin-like flavoprotein